MRSYTDIGTGFDYEEVDDEEVFHEEGEDPEYVENNMYHLQSAIKSHEDYCASYHYRKKFEKASAMYGGNIEVMDHITVMNFWQDFLPCSRYQRGYLPSDLAKLKETDHSLSSLEDLMVAEICSVDRGLSLGYVKNMIAKVLQDIESRFSEKMLVVKIINMLLVLMNSHQAAYKNDVERYSEYESILVTEDHIRVAVAPGLDFKCNRDYVIIQTGGSVKFVPVPYFLNSADKYQERLNVLIYTRIMEVSGARGVPTSDTVESVMLWGDRVLRKHGNQGYNMLGSYEAIIVGTILIKDDPEIVEDHGEFLKGVEDSLPDGTGDDLFMLKSVLLKQDVNQLSDIHGLYRIWGHPVIDIDGGLEKLRSISMVKKTVDDERGRMSGRMFKEIFVRNFYEKNGRYPKLTVLPGGEDTYIGSAVLSGTFISVTNVGYSLSGWDLIELEKVFEIPHTWNIVHNAKDKAISPTRSELCLSLSKGGKADQSNKRGILKLITSPLGSMREFLERTSVLDNIGTDDRIIGYYPKERELKVKPRFFSLMSYVMRLIMTSTEWLLGDKLLPYFPQITMNVNLLEMQKKMGDLSKKTKRGGRSITYVINMDFMKWNGQMRYDICKWVFQEIDKLFGLPGLIDNTHKLFESSLLYLCSGERKLYPDHLYGAVPDGKYAWINDPSGKEGLRQKGWTIMTVCDIMYVASKHACEVALVGGGDNQVLTVTYHSSNLDMGGEITEKGKEDIKLQMHRFMKDLDEHFLARGLPLKMSETWCSHSLFMYNKHMYYQGVPLRSVLKSVSRSFPFSNNQIMNLSSMVSNVHTIMKTSLQKEVLPFGYVILRYYHCCNISSIVLNMNPLLFCDEGTLCIKQGRVVRGGKDKIVCTDNVSHRRFILALLCLPSSFGGPGSIMYPSAVMRGFPDPVCEYVAIWKVMIQNMRMLHGGWLGLMEEMAGVSYNKSVHYAKLVEDPASINHDAPLNGSKSIRESARSTLLSMGHKIDPSFLEIVSTLNPADENNFYTELCSGDDLDPKVLNEIASSTLYGYANSLISRIDQTRTIMRLADNKDALTKVARDEYQYISYLHVMSTIQHDTPFGVCSRVTSDLIRLISWGKKVLGVTVPHPIEFLDMYDRADLPHKSGIVTRPSVSVMNDNKDLQLGDCRVYYGSYTREKFKSTEIASAYGDEDLLFKSISLLKLINWRYVEGSTMAELMKLTLKAISDIDTSLFIVPHSTVKGDFDHRRKMVGQMHGGIPNYMITRTSNYSVCTSSWVEHSKGGENENIHFQSCIIMTLLRNVLRDYSRVDMPPPRVSYAVCDTCICKLEEPVIERTTPKTIPSVPSCPTNPYVFVRWVDIRLDYESVIKMEEEQEGKGAINVDTLLEDDRYDTIAFLIYLGMCSSLTGIPESFFMMVSDRFNPEPLMSRIMWMHCMWKKCGMSSSLQVRSARPLVLAMRNPVGVYIMQKVLSCDSSFMEGPDTVGIDDFDEAAEVYQNKTPILSINLCLGNVPTQSFFSRLGSMASTLDCYSCIKGLQGIYYRRAPIREEHRCPIHQGRFPEDYPRVLNTHPDSILKTWEKQYEILDMKSTGPNPLVVIAPAPGPWPSTESVTGLQRLEEEMDIQNWVHTLQGALDLTVTGRIVIHQDSCLVQDICSLLSIMGCDDVRILVYVSKMAYSELDIFYENKRKLPMSEQWRLSETSKPIWARHGDVVVTHKSPKDVMWFFGDSCWVVSGLSQILSAPWKERIMYMYRTEVALSLGYVLLCKLGVEGGFMPGNLSMDLHLMRSSGRGKTYRKTQQTLMNRSKVPVDMSRGCLVKCNSVIFRSTSGLRNITKLMLAKVGLLSTGDRLKHKRRKQLRILTTWLASLLTHCSDDITSIVPTIRSIKYSAVKSIVFFKMEEGTYNKQLLQQYAYILEETKGTLGFSYLWKDVGGGFRICRDNNCRHTQYLCIRM
ncbi:RNA-dependent RNA polymerase [Peach virus 1]|uniref:RNA-directed RNA polymerase n=1 Tax=Peach virus 1 TaxID=2721273 RepID=A0A6G9L659_9RHAB|nr:RNA-dependent RNA polymerase [Peach virus 1]QIQ60850.1 RNA-dependent RNA polymerase [Peach virus 1]